MRGVAIGAIVLIALLFNACSKDADCTKTVDQSEIDEVNAAQLAIDNAIIEDYIIANNIENTLGPVQELNGIRYVITKEGSGVTPCLENNIIITYTGRLMSDNTVFDSNLSGVSFSLNNLILGWKVTMPSFTKGTVVTLFVPSGYGYGPGGYPPRIPPNANLKFDITLSNIR